MNDEDLKKLEEQVRHLYDCYGLSKDTLTDVLIQIEQYRMINEVY